MKKFISILLVLTMLFSITGIMSVAAGDKMSIIVASDVHYDYEKVSKIMPKPEIEQDEETGEYDIETVKTSEMVMMQLYPEIYACIGCNACTKACTQELNVMQYIAYAQRGDWTNCAEESFDCVMCGVCSSRCPAGISHPQVAELARRIYGKYLAPESKHLIERVKEIDEGVYKELIETLMNKPVEELKELYNNRDIEK